MKLHLHSLLYLVAVVAFAHADSKPRARDLGIPFDGNPGPLNAITDVPGVAVGHTTLISGQGKLKVSFGPIRTGVTAVLPRGKGSVDPVFASWFSQNGNGEMTGTTWVEESGFLEGPVMTTNTSSVGVVRDAVVKYFTQKAKHQQPWVMPVVAETYDGFLNDTHGFHVKEEHAFHALESAQSGPVPEGSVGGGTGMICYGFKGGIGTASRKVSVPPDSYIVGVLMQANFGGRNQLRIGGIPMGEELHATAAPAKESGSVIVVVATDAPLLPHQIKRLTRRVSMGLARTGSTAGNSSGDIFIAFSTANPKAAQPGGLAALTMLPNDRMDPLFEAVVQATEEAVINALVAGQTMVGRDDHKVLGLPHEKVREILKKHNRLVEGRGSSVKSARPRSGSEDGK